MTRLAEKTPIDARVEDLRRNDGVIDAIAASGYRIFTTMANDAGVFLGFASLGASLLRATLEPAVREAVILRIAHLVGSEYEWAHHAPAARAAGLEDTAIDSIRDDPDRLEDARLVAAVHLASRVETGTVDDRTWHAAAAHFAPDELVQIVVIAGYYGLASRYALAINLQPDDLDQLPRA